MLESYKSVVVSNGTHRTENLARSFYKPVYSLYFEALEQHNMEVYKKCIALRRDLEHIHNFYECVSRFNLNKEGEETEEFIDVINDVFDVLNEYAPEGYYFGTLEGDGACFGFWPLYNDDNDDED